MAWQRRNSVTCPKWPWGSGWNKILSSGHFYQQAKWLS